MQKALILLIAFPFLVKAQELPNKGIEWAKNKSWLQVKLKAKAENKYIFLDCYATWCAPCKMMDKDVYTNDSVAMVINSDFISVKVQMDTSKNDDADIKGWYQDAYDINTQFGVSSLPTFLFFSPDGELIHKGVGYKDVQSFITLTTDALDPDKQYFSLLRNYQRGNNDYSRMPYLANTALVFNDKETAIRVADDYIKNYLSHLPMGELLKKANVVFLTTHTKASDAPGFDLLYNNYAAMDSISKNFFCQKVLHYIIYKEEVAPKTKSYFQAKLPFQNWDQLESSIKDKYDKYFAKRTVGECKIRLYKRLTKWPEHSKSILDFVLYFKESLSNDELNSYGWDLFQHSSDKVALKTATEWMKDVVSSEKDSSNLLPNSLDTYANLMYKQGRKKAGFACRRASS